MKKKLYECEIRMTYYAYAEDEYEACRYARDAMSDSYESNNTTVREVTEPVLKPLDGWDRTCLIYHRGRNDITLGDALDERDGWRKP